MSKRWLFVLGMLASLAVAFVIVIRNVGVPVPLPEHHGLDGVEVLDGLQFDVMLPVNAFQQMTAAPDPDFAVDPDGGIWMISNGEVWRARESGESQIAWEQLDPDWKGLHSLALTHEGALIAARGLLLTQYSEYTEGQKPLAKLLGLDGLLLPNKQMKLASSNLPGTIYAFGTGEEINNRVYGFYDAGETAIICEVPDPVQAVADGKEGLYVATAREIYRFDIDGEHKAVIFRQPADAPPIRAIAISPDEKTLVWSTDKDINVIEGRASMPLVVGFGGVVRILKDSLYAYSDARHSLIRIRLPEPH